jgi:hypothetical protein
MRDPAQQPTVEQHNAMVAEGRRIQHEATVVWMAYQRLSPAAKWLFIEMKHNAAVGRPGSVDPVAVARMEAYLARR